MGDLPDGDAAEPEHARSGAFVLRAWIVHGSIRARVRSTLDVADPEATRVVDLLGGPDALADQASGLLHQWLDDFGGDAPVTRS